jgi:hypothetical protein
MTMKEWCQVKMKWKRIYRKYQIQGKERKQLSNVLLMQQIILLLMFPPSARFKQLHTVQH